MKVHAELDTRLKRAIGQLGDHEKTWQQGEGALNDLVDQARDKLYEARALIALRQSQHDARLADH